MTLTPDPAGLALAALLIAVLALFALDHRRGQQQLGQARAVADEALDRANRERADKMLAFTAVDEMVQRAREIADTPPLPHRIPGTGPQIPSQRRGAA